MYDSVPQAGQLLGTDEESAWAPIEASEDGTLPAPQLRGAYLYFAIEREEAGDFVLEAAGHSAAIINGRPRVGNPYGGWYRIPVHLQAGTNHLYFKVGRGGFRGSLTAAQASVSIETSDATLPDVIAGKSARYWAALPVLNLSTENRTDLRIEARLQTPAASEGGGHATQVITPVDDLLPHSIQKVPFEFESPASEQPGKMELKVKLISGEETLAENRVEVQVVEVTARRRETFRSHVDGSVQYFSLVPPLTSSDEPRADTATQSGSASKAEPLALYLTLHGASVEATSQAGAYQPKPGALVVAPTNRRPFGFDWEDWGRLDALEVLEIVQQQHEIDPQRIYLTGHSMGGHGTWNVAANTPGRFAAIGPSAGWISFRSYLNARRNAGNDKSAADESSAADRKLSPAEILRMAASTSDTLGLSSNYTDLGIYILHGDADDNVPVSEARKMRSHLGEWHPDFAYYERPGAGHWWGNECCDWRPMFEFFRAHQRRPWSDRNQLQFATVNPAVHAACGGVTIYQQCRPHELSSVQISVDREQGQIQATTTNVCRLALDLQTGLWANAERKSRALTIDDNSIEIPGQSCWLKRDGGSWQLAEQPSLQNKGPHRNGLFKSAFQHEVVLVYGTQGDAQDNQWARQKAQYDAEQFWYRGNGNFRLVSDRDFKPADFPDRNVVLYGNAATNSAWDPLLAACPLRVDDQGVQLANAKWEGDLASLFVYPRADSDTAMVGVVAGTTLTACRSLDLLPYFVSGVGIPDVVVYQVNAMIEGVDAIQLTGFWSVDWAPETLWRYDQAN